MKPFFYILFCLTFISFTACNNNKTGNSSDASNMNQTIAKLVIDWNDDLNNKKMEELTALYADSVSFYGKMESKEQVIHDKAIFLEKNSDFSQQIVDKMISVSKLSVNEYKATFRKISATKEHSNEVDAYLIFRKKGDAWKIFSENDAVTERNLSKKAAPADGIKNCEDLAERILWTSPYFKKRTNGLEEAIKKNGGDSYGIMLEESPGVFGGETTETYGFSLHESYPDRMVTIERFQYNPKKQKLYRYDAAADTSIEIDFDRTLLERYKNLCD